VTEQRNFDGTLLEVPFGSETVHSVAVEQYRDLLADHDPEDVLVLTGSPTSMTTFREVLGDECPGAAVPYVTSVIVHATDIINRTDDRAILSDAMRRELVHRFLADREWDHEYFQQASQQESFISDIADLLETATWQNVTFDTTPELQEVATLRDAFHAWLDAHDHLERGQMIAEATDIIAGRASADPVVDIDAILAIEFEEFVESDRQYLQQLAVGRDLVCIAETDASIRRTWTETGPITDHVSFTDHQSVDATPPATRPAATAAYFSQDRVPADPGTGDVQVIAADTAADELDRIADEIEQLRDQHDIAYKEMAVTLKYSGEAVIDAMQTLEQAGIPTESATIIGFGDDPAIRELLQVVCTLASESEVDAEIPDATEDPDLTDALQTTLAEMDHLGEAVRMWATESGLKELIAADTAPLTARTRFGNVRRAFNMADFLEDTEFIDATWASFAEMLTRAHEYAPQQNQTSAIDRDGGVRVDHVRAIKNGAFRVVFVPQVTDDRYPGQPRLSSLFPQERVTRMPDYPGVSQVDTDAVTATFPTDSTASSRPVRQYHAEHARRLLAIGAASATERLYLSLHTHEDTALDERVQPSRFLADAYRECPWLTAAGESPINTELAAEAFLLSRVDKALADVRRANSQDVTISLDDVETDFAEIQALLADSGERGEQLREALHARLDFAAGRVRRE
jgi:hypothetical protein